MKVILVASSVVAAELLIGGKMSHYTFHISLDITDTSTCNVAVEPEYAQELLGTHFIVCTKSWWYINIVSKLLADFWKIFCGYSSVSWQDSRCAGYFHQILPVTAEGSKAQTIRSGFKFPKPCNHFTTITISENIVRLKSLRDDPNADEEALNYT